jgi:hypothetical protein
MSTRVPLSFPDDPTRLPLDQREKHETLVDLFGQFLFWLRNGSLSASREFVMSEEIREKLGTIRRAYYDGVAQMPPEKREAALLLAQETLDGFIERLLWAMGDEGTDARFGTHHAYRFRIEMEIVDVESGRVVEEETINRGGKFFGNYWGRWLNRFGKSPAAS